MNDSTQTIRPATGMNGSVRLPGDKSISHRYAILAALARGTTRLENYSTAADCASTLRCVEQLGCGVRRDGGSIVIDGRAGALVQPSSPLDCGNSGSTMRMLAGVLAAQPFASEMIGDESLSRRPMRRIVEPLLQMGARVEAGAGDRPPLRITGSKLHAIDYSTPIASAQVKSCVLLAGLHAEGETSVTEPVRTRDHTEIALRAFGVEVERRQNRVSIRGGQSLTGLEAYVPGDISTATFFLCAASIFPGSRLIFDNVLLNPTRALILDIMAGMGLQISFLRVEEQHGELIGTIQVESSPVRGTRISGAATAALIDELPALAALAPYTETGIEIRDARELRVKESDRIAAVSENLRRMGARVEEFEDGLRVAGQQRLHGAELESYGDHRVAMAFSVAALGAEGESQMNGADAVAVSFPEFYPTMESLIER